MMQVKPPTSSHTRSQATRRICSVGAHHRHIGTACVGQKRDWHCQRTIDSRHDRQTNACRQMLGRTLGTKRRKTRDRRPTHHKPQSNQDVPQDSKPLPWALWGAPSLRKAQGEQSAMQGLCGLPSPSACKLHRITLTRLATQAKARNCVWASRKPPLIAHSMDQPTQTTRLIQATPVMTLHRDNMVCGQALGNRMSATTVAKAAATNAPEPPPHTQMQPP